MRFSLFFISFCSWRHRRRRRRRRVIKDARLARDDARLFVPNIESGSKLKKAKRFEPISLDHPCKKIKKCFFFLSLSLSFKLFFPPYIIFRLSNSRAVLFFVSFVSGCRVGVLAAWDRHRLDAHPSTGQRKNHSRPANNTSRKKSHTHKKASCVRDQPDVVTI